MRTPLERLEPRRLLAAGDLDLAFGHNGIIKKAQRTRMEVHDLQILSDDRILIAGALLETGESYLLRRYNADGTIDSSFGSNGTALGRFTG